jgi:3-isopropylmalate/(R)-2-methylmalate dehydratase small subunit
MKSFSKHTGVVAPIDRVNVDTDQIIPKQFLKRIEKTGFGQYLFYDWRFDKDGKLNPDFVLNRAGYVDASILVSGRNFGSGSSREHAPWALMDYGIRCVIAPSYADIFQKNCFENGLIPVLLSEDLTNRIIDNASDKPGYAVTVDLEECRVTDNLGLNTPMVIHKEPDTHNFRRYCLINGLDDIGLVLQQEDKILEYENNVNS